MSLDILKGCIDTILHNSQYLPKNLVFRNKTHSLNNLLYK